MGYVRLNTIFVPGEELTKSALQIAAEISRGRKEYFHIDNENYFAHVSVYVAYYKLTDVEKVFEVVESFASQLNKHRVLLKFDSVHSDGGYVWVDYKLTDELCSIHEKVLELLEPVRVNYIDEKDTRGLEEGKYNPLEIEYLRKYGYRLVMKNYHPHITIARFVSSEDGVKAVSEIKKFSHRQLSGYSNLMAVGTYDKNGTCTKIVKTFPLVGK